jgi:chemotaxis signal transduction protein
VSAVWVRLQVGEEQYSLPVEDVLEIADVGTPRGVPGAPACVLGVVNRHGQVLPVLDLARVISGTAEGQGKWLVVVEAAGLRAGVTVDEVLDVGPAAALIAAPESELLSGAAMVDGARVGMLDTGVLLSAGSASASGRA